MTDRGTDMAGGFRPFVRRPDMVRRRSQENPVRRCGTTDELRAGMGHPLRWYEPGAVYEITIRTIREQFLLRPCAQSRNLILGVIGRAQHLFPAVALHYFVYMSNHAHFLLSATDGESIAPFMGFVNANVAKVIGRVRESGGPIWGRRMRAIRVVDDESSIDRLTYLLSHGCKEGLVAAPADWPGASAYAGFVGDMTLEGTWITREHTRGGRGRKKGSSVERACVYPVVLSPIPAWSRLDDESLRARHAALVEDVVLSTSDRNRALGRTPLGIDAVLAIDPWARPQEPSRSRAPECHAASADARAAYRAAYREFKHAYRAASTRERTGEKGSFPAGAWPCAGAFVTWPGQQPRRAHGATPTRRGHPRAITTPAAIA